MPPLPGKPSVRTNFDEALNSDLSYNNFLFRDRMEKIITQNGTRVPFCTVHQFTTLLKNGKM